MRKIVLPLILVIILSFGYFIFNSNLKDLGRVDNKLTSNYSAVSRNGEFHILLDGWSAALIKDGKWRFKTDSVDTKTGQSLWEGFTFQPLQKDDVKIIYAENPHILKTNTARLFHGSPDLSCENTGCIIDKQNYNLDQLAEIEKSNIYPVLRDHGVESLLYIASLNLDKNTSAISLSVDGGKAFEIIIDRLGSESNVLRDDTAYISYALGEIFTPKTVWSDGLLFETLSLSSETDNATPEMLSVGLNGLSDKSIDISKISRERLTWLSSPTIGCDPVFFCTAKIAGASVVSLKEVESYRVCEANDLSRDGILLLSTIKVSVNFEQLNHTAGLSSEKPSYYPNRTIAVNPKGFEGVKEVFLDRMIFIDGGSIVEIWGANADLDLETMPTEYFNSSDLAKYSNNKLTLC